MKLKVLTLSCLAMAALVSCSKGNNANDSNADSGTQAAQNEQTTDSKQADGLTKISSADAKVFGDQASYVKIDASKDATMKIDKNSDGSGKIVIKVPLVLEKTLKYGKDTGTSVGFNIVPLDANGDEISVKGLDFKLGSKSLDIGVYDELQAFMESEPGATIMLPYNIDCSNPETFPLLDEAMKNVASYKLTGFTFLHLPENAE